MRRFPQILLIWLGCSLAWTILGSTLVARTGGASSALMREVHLLWGKPLEQGRPRAGYTVMHPVRVQSVREEASGRKVQVDEQRMEASCVDLPLEGSALAVRLDLTHRRKGLLWFPTYAVDFDGRYTFANPGETPREVTFTFPLAGESTIYDGFAVRDANGAPVEARVDSGAARWSATLAPGERRAYAVRYRSRGTSTWGYPLTDGAGQVKDFTLTVDADAPDIDFAPGSIAPSRQERGPHHWRGTWRFDRLVASAPIGLVLPERMNPGPLASRITFFAPVGLLFFLFVTGILATAAGRVLHPMHYFFFGCAFFAFHLLFAYLVDHLAIGPSFALASAVSVLLVATYARLFTGWAFALRTLAVAQVLYLVLFSFTFFWQGYTGLAITVGAILTLFVMMQTTGRTDWDRATTGAVPAEPRRA
jgi:hypothetical protein